MLGSRKFVTKDLSGQRQAEGPGPGAGRSHGFGPADPTDADTDVMSKILVVRRYEALRDAGYPDVAEQIHEPEAFPDQQDLALKLCDEYIPDFTPRGVTVPPVLTQVVAERF